MPRLNENERLPMVDAHVAHWTQANALPGGPIVLPILNPDGTPGTYARADLLAQRSLRLYLITAASRSCPPWLPAPSSPRGRSERSISTRIGLAPSRCKGENSNQLQYRRISLGLSPAALRTNSPTMVQAQLASQRTWLRLVLPCELTECSYPHRRPAWRTENANGADER